MIDKDFKNRHPRNAGTRLLLRVAALIVTWSVILVMVK